MEHNVLFSSLSPGHMHVRKTESRDLNYTGGEYKANMLTSLYERGPEARAVDCGE